MNMESRRKRQRASTDNKGPSLRKRPKKSLKEPDSQASDEPQWWSVQAVLEERKRPGKPIEYKVLWDPNPQTGETYPPSWEPAAHLTADLLAEWTAKNGSARDQAAHEPLSQAHYHDHSLTTKSSTTTRSGLRRLDLAPSRDFSAPASPSTAAESSPSSPPNQELDPEAENGGAAAGNFATGIVIETHADFPRDEYQADLSQRADFQTSQTWPSSQLAQESQATPERDVPAHQADQKAEKTPKVIPDSQSQGNIALVETSPVQSFFGSPELQQRVSHLLHYHECTTAPAPASSAASRRARKQTEFPTAHRSH